MVLGGFKMVNVPITMVISNTSNELISMLINQYTMLVIPILLFLLGYVASRLNFSER